MPGTFLEPGSPLAKPRSFRWATAWYGLALIIAVATTYSNGVHAPFIFDDSTSIDGNPSIHKLWPLVGNAENPGPLNPPRDLPTSGRPLVNITLALNYHFGRLNPVGYHLFNIAVHVLSTLLLWATMKRILQLDFLKGRFTSAAEPLAFLVALLWALHPLQTETVEYITQRTELMVGFFYLAVLYCSLRYWSAECCSRQITWLVLATLACWTGMACKEVMVTVPVIVLLLQRTFISRSFSSALRNSWPLYLGLFASWFFLWALNSDAPRAGSAGFYLGLPAYVWWFTQAKVFWMYMKLVIWPWPLLIHYEMEYMRTFSQAWPWLLASIPVGIAILVMFYRRKAVGLIGACVLIILSPTLIVPIPTEVAAERRMYLPSAALVSLLVACCYWLVQQATISPVSSHRTPNARAPVFVAAFLAVALGLIWSWIDVTRLATFQDPITLWQVAATVQPNNFLAHNNWAIALSDAGRAQEAIEQFRIALQLKPNEAESHSNLGSALMQAGRPLEAIQEHQQALQLKPTNGEFHNNLGLALMSVGQYPEAVKQFQDAVKYKTDYFNARNNLGNALRRAGQLQEAIDQYKLALQINPLYASAHANLATTYGRMNQLEQAIVQAETAIELANAQGDASLAHQMRTWLSNYRAGLSNNKNRDSNADGTVAPSK